MMTQNRARWSCSAGAAAVLLAAAAGQAQTVFYFEDFESASRSTVSTDPTLDGSCASSLVWTKTPPAGWNINDCGVPTYTCRVGSGSGCNPLPPCRPTCGNNAGVREWEGFSFADRVWWQGIAGDQRRTEFLLGTGTVAIADGDTWDDFGSPANNCGLMYTYMNTPSVSLDGADPNTLTFGFDSSYRPENWAILNGQIKDQTAKILAIYTVNGAEVSVEILHWNQDDRPADPNDPEIGRYYKPDAPNEHVVLTPDIMAVPAGATSVRFEFSYTGAGNDWWWAFDNIAVTASVNGSNTAIFTEDFEELPLGRPISATSQGRCGQYCGVPIYTHDGFNGLNVIAEIAPSDGSPNVPATGGVDDWRGWSFTEVPFWNCVSGQNRGRFTNGSGTVAIADGDEWTDRSFSPAGQLDTSMTTPVINISGRSGSAIVLSFDNSWRPENPQTATITATFDVGEPVQAVRWESNPASPFFKDTAYSELFVTPIVVPAGATTMQLKFNYKGGNNWWWAVDNLSVFEGLVTVTLDNTAPRETFMALAPTVNFPICFAPWAPTAPVGWTESFPTGDIGRAEWRGWSFPWKEWWYTNVDNQARDQFTRGRGFVAVADPDEWDDTGTDCGGGPACIPRNGALFNGFMTSPDIALPANLSDLAFDFDSSWRPEGLQTATLVATYQTAGGPVQVEVLRFESNDTFADGTPNPNFYPDVHTNDALHLDNTRLQAPAGATSVKFEFGLTIAGNNWWWAVDNLVLSASGNVLFSEDFEQPQDIQAPPTERLPTTLCAYFSTVAAQQNGFTVDNSGILADCPSSGATDFRGFNSWLTQAWAQTQGSSPRQQFDPRTAFVSDFAALGCTTNNTAYLVSAATDITLVNPNSLILTFASSWGSQTRHRSTVEVSFDGGAWINVLDWNADAPIGSPTFKATAPNEVITITIPNPAGARSVQYRMGDRNSGWWAVSDLVLTGTVGATPCPADFNADGVLNSDDLSDYITSYFNVPPDLATDFNNDGVVNADDLGDFITAYFNGC